VVLVVVGVINLIIGMHVVGGVRATALVTAIGIGDAGGVRGTDPGAVIGIGVVGGVRAMDFVVIGGDVSVVDNLEVVQIAVVEVVVAILGVAIIVPVVIVVAVVVLGVVVIFVTDVPDVAGDEFAIFITVGGVAFLVVAAST